MAAKRSCSQSCLPFKRVRAVQETTASSSEGTGSSAHTIGSEGDSDSLLQLALKKKSRAFRKNARLIVRRRVSAFPSVAKIIQDRASLGTK